jgi:hypothetical protein
MREDRWASTTDFDVTEDEVCPSSIDQFVNLLSTIRATYLAAFRTLFSTWGGVTFEQSIALNFGIINQHHSPGGCELPARHVVPAGTLRVRPYDFCSTRTRSLQSAPRRDFSQERRQNNQFQGVLPAPQAYNRNLSQPYPHITRAANVKDITLSDDMSHDGRYFFTVPLSQDCHYTAFILLSPHYHHTAISFHCTRRCRMP